MKRRIHLLAIVLATVMLVSFFLPYRVSTDSLVNSVIMAGKHLSEDDQKEIDTFGQIGNLSLFNLIRITYAERGDPGIRDDATAMIITFGLILVLSFFTLLFMSLRRPFLLRLFSMLVLVAVFIYNKVFDNGTSWTYGVSVYLYVVCATLLFIYSIYLAIQKRRKRKITKAQYDSSI